MNTKYQWVLDNSVKIMTQDSAFMLGADKLIIFLNFALVFIKWFKNPEGVIHYCAVQDASCSGMQT